MLLLSTAASVTGTVAWFSMNNFVTAKGMNIQAKAENGIVIANASDSATWTDESNAANAGTGLEVYPTSTNDASTWAHSSSNNADSATSNGKYTMLTTVVDDGVGFVDEDADNTFDSGESAYYLVNSFFIKSSAEAITKTIYVTNVKAAFTGQSQTSANLDKALRVLVKSGSTVAIYAPFSGATLSYNVCTAYANDTATTTATTAIDASGTDGHIAAASQAFLSNHEIPAYTSNSPTEIKIYIYFEGEDANCKSTNLAATLDTLSVEVKFGTSSVADPVNP